MTDSPSSILLLRLQSTGSNVNLWGGYLNTALQTLEQASKGYQPLTVSGSATISWSNYTTGNTGQCAFLRLTGPSGDGTLGSGSTLTFPNNQNFVSVWNATGAAVTIMCAAGTGVAIPTGAGALLYCDGTDYKNALPTIFPAGITLAGQIHGVTPGTAATDATNLAQVSAAIAAASLPATAGTVLNSVNDNAANYLSLKLDAATAASDLATIALTTESPGAEKSLFTISTRRVLRRALFVGQV